MSKIILLLLLINVLVSFSKQDYDESANQECRYSDCTAAQLQVDGENMENVTSRVDNSMTNNSILLVKIKSTKHSRMETCRTSSAADAINEKGLVEVFIKLIPTVMLAFLAKVLQ